MQLNQAELLVVDDEAAGVSLPLVKMCCVQSCVISHTVDVSLDMLPQHAAQLS